MTLIVKIYPYVGNYAPYGYKKSAEDKNRLVVDEYAAEIVQSVFSMYKDGLSVGRIAEKLNDMGVLSPMEYKRSQGIRFDTLFKTKERADWSYNTVKRILTNEIYIGVLAQGKTGTPNYKVRKVQPKDESDWIKVEGVVEPLVSYTDFMDVKTMLGRDMRCTADKDESNLLSGFLFCADCGQSMIRKTIPSKNKRYIYYVCSTAKHKKGCSSHCVSAQEVQDAVLHAIHDQVGLVLDMEKALKMIDSLPSADRKTFNFEVQETRLKEEIERLQGLKLRLYEDLSEGVIDRNEYTEFRNRYTAMIADKDEAIKRVHREWQDSKVTGNENRQWVALFREYENIEELNRRAMMALIDRILIHEEHGIEICFKYGTEYRQTEEFVSGYTGELAETEVR